MGGLLWTGWFTVKTDCIHFRGDVPCFPHKQEGVHCECKHYKKIGKRVLIIKLGAAGDVIRTTPLLWKLHDYDVTWLTNFPELIPCKGMRLNTSTSEILRHQFFDWVINLDKDPEAISMASNISTYKLSGFTRDINGKCIPANALAEHKWLTGLWDDENKANKKHYIEEIFEICGFEFNDEPYLLPHDRYLWSFKGGLIGLNTGCGERWKTREWPTKNWIDLANLLRPHVLLLGGEAEHKKNQWIAQITGARYEGHFELGQFIDLVDQCDTVVTQATMALHIAIGLKKRVILLNNIFNKSEFHLYGNGTVIEPDLKCLGCFKQIFDHNCPVDNCMELIKPERVAEVINGN